MTSVNSSNPKPDGSSGSGSRLDPGTNLLRYSVSPQEYDLLYKYVLAHTPVVNSTAPAPAKFRNAVKPHDDYNASTIRLALRLSAATLTALKVWENVALRLLARGKPLPVIKKPALYKQGSFRLSASLGLILAFHRFLHRFLLRLRQSLLTDNAKPFRQRNPFVSAVLTSRLAPVVGASGAGFFLGVYPAQQLRITITLYMLTRSLEFLYNHIENLGLLENKPWWFGSWLLMPAACGQLLHAFVFDRDCFPASYGDFIMKNSSTYLQGRPEDIADKMAWPSSTTIVESLGNISKLNWPKFISPIQFPTSQTLPISLAAVYPITSAAQPTIENLSCALLHPNDTSCSRTYLSFFLQSFGGIFRYFAVIYGAFSLLRIQAIAAHPLPALTKLLKAIFKSSLFVTGAVGTAWGSICWFQKVLPAKFLPTQRWFFGGSLGGLWAFIDRDTGRSNALFSTRLSLDSLWKVGVKRRWWNGIKNGDVLLSVLGLALMQSIYEVDPKAINSPIVRKALSVLRGDGWIDRALAIEGSKGNTHEVDATNIAVDRKLE